ncbi:hypothetical protein IJG72_02760 [bacterium]|nr:hypothetical protein [bacterium]
MERNNISQYNIILLSVIIICFLLFLPKFIIKYQKEYLVNELRYVYTILDSGFAANIVNNRDSYNNKAVYEKGLYIYLQNGAYIDMDKTDKGILFTCDINGFKGPNKDGRDIFDFFVNFDDKYNVLPMNFENNTGSKRIIDDGWKMEY